MLDELEKALKAAYPGTPAAVETPVAEPVVVTETPAAAAPTTTTEVVPPVTEPVTQTTPPSVTEPTTPTPAVFDWSSFGEGMDEAKVREALNRIPELESKVNANPYANEYISKLNEYVRNGGDANLFNRAWAVDTTTMTDADKLSMRMQVESGWSKEDADFYVNNKYNLGEEYDSNDPAVRMSRMELKRDAAMASTFLDKFKADGTTPPPPPADTFAQYQQEASVRAQTNLQAITPVIGALTTELATLEVGDGLNYPVSQATLTALKEHLSNVVQLPEFATEVASDKEAIRGLAQDFIIAREYQSMLKWQATELQKKFIADKSNVRQPEGTSTPPGQIDQSGKHLADQVARQFGMTMR